MRVYRYEGNQTFQADAPDGALAICLGPMADRDAKITAIDWTRKRFKEEVSKPFPEKWYNPDTLDWKPYFREER